MVKGKGLHRLGSTGSYKLLVREKVVTPKRRAQEQKRLRGELAESLGEPISPDDKGILKRIKDALA